MLLFLLVAPPGAKATEDEASCAGPDRAADRDGEALRLGRKVLAVKRAIDNPGRAGAMEAIVELGTDSRYYVMVRGWLVMQLQADLAMLKAGRGEAPAGIAERVEFLQGAIRAIDLE